MNALVVFMVVTLGSVIGIGMMAEGGFKSNSNIEMGCYILYVVWSMGMGLYIMILFKPRTQDNKNLKEDVMTNTKDLGKQVKGKISDSVRYLDMAKIRKRSFSGASEMASAATGLLLIDTGRITEAKIISGNKNCCKQLMIMEKVMYCLFDSNGKANCHAAERGDIISLASDGMVAVNGTFVCVNYEGCAMLEPMVISYMAAIMKVIVIGLAIKISIMVTARLYPVVNKTIKRTTIDKETGEIKNTETYHYFSIPKLIIILACWFSAAVTIYTLAAVTLGSANVSALVINKGDRITNLQEPAYGPQMRMMSVDYESDIRSHLWSCELDMKMYALNGVTKTICNSKGPRTTGRYKRSVNNGEMGYGLENQYNNGTTTESYPESMEAPPTYDDETYTEPTTEERWSDGTPEYEIVYVNKEVDKNVDPRCLKRDVITDRILKGIVRCSEVCEVVNMIKRCKIVYNGINTVKVSPTISDSNTYDFTGPKLRLLLQKAAGESYTVQLFNGFYNAWDDHQIDNPSFEGGIIKTFEADGSENPDESHPDCNFANGNVAGKKNFKRGFICTKLRREMVTCEKGYYGRGALGATEFECIKYSREEAGSYLPNFLNPYLDTSHIEKTGEMAFIKEDLPIKTTFTLASNDYTFEGKIAYLESSQDSDQTSGQDKYFVYSAILSGNLTGAGSVGTFAAGLKNLMWQNAMSSATSGKDLTTVPTYSLLQPTKFNDVPSLFFKWIVEPEVNALNCRSGFQDRAKYSIVVKSDVITAEGKSYNQECGSITSAFTCGQNVFSKSTEVVIPIYIAARLYGPAKAEFRLFNHKIDTVTLTNGLSDCLDCIKVRGKWYKPDFDTVNTEVTVTGFPLTHMTGLFNVKSSTGCNGFEAFWFYLAHPKMGAALYLSKVADTADRGLFSTKGKCKQTYMKDGQMMCDGNVAMKIPIVKYTTFYRELTSDSACHVRNNTLTCSNTLETEFHDCTKGIDQMKSFNCKVSRGYNITRKLEPNTINTLRFNDEMMFISRGTSHCSNCLFSTILDLSYRCDWCLVLLACFVGFGYIAGAVLLIAMILAMINWHNLVCILSAIGLMKRCQICTYCKGYVKTREELAKHKEFCANLNCPHCIRVKDFDDGTRKLYRRRYETYEALRAHVRSVHSMSCINPVLSSITINRKSVIAFIYVEWLIMQSGAQIISHHTGLRSEHVGLGTTVDSNLFECTESWCTMTGTAELDLPIVVGSRFSLSTKHDDTDYSATFEVKRSEIETVCTYEYTAMSFSEGDRKTTVKCTETTDCSKFTWKDLSTPLGTGVGADYVPFTTVNPLKTWYCPGSFTCKSPAVGATWITAGCFSINTGIAVGYKVLVPDPFKLMIPVFQCKVKNLIYEVCSEKDCKVISTEGDQITNSTLKFPKIERPLDTIFNVGVLVKQGDIAARFISFGPPAKSQVSTSGYYQFKALDLPQAETCLSGMTAASVFCEIAEDGLHPATHCQSQSLDISPENYPMDVASITDHINCNAEDTLVSWSTNVISRSAIVNGETYSDTQTVSRPSLDLKLKACNFGSKSVRIENADQIKLRANSFVGDITKTKCEGHFNRNGKAMITFNLEVETNGMLKLDCGDGTSNLCHFNTELTNRCNLTVLMPAVYTCKYNDKTIKVDCTNTTLIDPDLASGTIMRGSGSGDFNTWTEGFMFSLSSPIGISSLVIGSIIMLVLVVFFYKVCLGTCQSRSMGKAMGRQLRMRNNDFKMRMSNAWKRKMY